MRERGELRRVCVDLRPHEHDRGDAVGVRAHGRAVAVAVRRVSGELVGSRLARQHRADARADDAGDREGEDPGREAEPTEQSRVHAKDGEGCAARVDPPTKQRFRGGPRRGSTGRRNASTVSP